MASCIDQWEPTARFLLKHHLGATVQESDSWESLKQEVSRSSWLWLWTQGVRDHGLFRHGHLYKGAVEGLKTLSQHADLAIVTSRPRGAIQDTLDWLAFHRFPVSEVHVLGNDRPKSSVKMDVYVDDALHNAVELQANAAGSKVLLWNRPWNQGDTPPGVIRVDNWEHVLQEVTHG